MLNYLLLLRRLSALVLRPARNPTATMTLEDVSAIITAARENFVPISSKPQDNYLLRMREFRTLILLGIPYNTADGNHNLWGILSSDAAYKVQHRNVFAPPHGLLPT